jgi:hypothetical protein
MYGWAEAKRHKQDERERAGRLQSMMIRRFSTYIEIN